eukprot:jgi/Astpho2/5239/Aster-04814
MGGLSLGPQASQQQASQQQLAMQMGLNSMLQMQGAGGPAGQMLANQQPHVPGLPHQGGHMDLLHQQQAQQEMLLLSQQHLAHQMVMAGAQQGRQMGGADGTEGARQHQGQQEMGLGQARQGYTAVRTDSDFGSASSLPSNASGALSVQSGRGQSLPQGLGQEGIRDKLTGGGSLTPQLPTASGALGQAPQQLPPGSAAGGGGSAAGLQSHLGAAFSNEGQRQQQGSPASFPPALGRGGAALGHAGAPRVYADIFRAKGQPQLSSSAPHTISQPRAGAGHGNTSVREPSAAETPAQTLPPRDQPPQQNHQLPQQPYSSGPLDAEAMLSDRLNQVLGAGFGQHSGSPQDSAPGPLQHQW